MSVTAKIVLHLIPEQLKSQPVFLCIDDTMISKFGTKFENVSNSIYKDFSKGEKILALNNKRIEKVQAGA